MAVFTASLTTGLLRTETRQDEAPKDDWPLMGDVASFRAGVPEAVIRWRAARGEDAPRPCEPEFLRRAQNSL